MVIGREAVYNVGTGMMSPNPAEVDYAELANFLLHHLNGVSAN